MAVSVNGWPAFTNWNPHPELGWLTVKVTKGSIRVYTLRSLFALWTNFILDWDAHVGPVNTCESFDPRPIAGTNVWSTHASGTAIDINSAVYKQHLDRMPAIQQAHVRDLIRWYEPVLEWGGDWRDPFLDQMHTQIAQSNAADGRRVVSQAQVNAVVKKGRYVHPAPPPPKPPVPTPTPVPVPPAPKEEDMAILVTVTAEATGQAPEPATGPAGDYLREGGVATGISYADRHLPANKDFFNALPKQIISDRAGWLRFKNIVVPTATS